MEDSLVSIIIPIYNSEKFLERCVMSCIKQTYQNIEIILVNDGSTDSSPVICDKLSELYEQVVVLHRENGGVSRARNDGMNIAKGEYITFVDSDDYVSPVYIEKLVRLIKLNNVQLAICGYTSKKEELVCSANYNESIRYIKAEHIYNHMLNNERYEGYLWNKLFVRKIIVENKMLFPEDVLVWEDMYFVLCYLKSIYQVVEYDEKLYFYRVEGQGVTSQITIKKMESMVKVCKLFVDLENSKEKLYYIAARKLLIRQLIQYLKGTLRECIEDKHIVREYMFLLEEYLKVCVISKKEYIWARILLILTKIRYLKE